MRFAWITAVKDLRRFRRDPIAFLIWLGIPVCMEIVLVLVFGGGGARPQGRLLVADEDESLVSSALVGAFSRGELGNMIVVEKVTQVDGRRRIERGDGSALLVIPKGLGQAFLRSEPFSLRLITNPSQGIMPGVIEEAVSVLLDAGSYAQLLAGDELRAFAPGGPMTDQAVAALSVTFNKLGRAVGAYVDPLRIELETEVVEQESPIRTNFGGAFFPGYLFMTILFVTTGLSADLWRERAHGTLRRAVSSPGSLEAFLAGKTLAVAAALCVVGLAGLISARWLLRVQVARPALALVWIFLSATVLYLLAAVMQSMAATERGANIVVNVVVLPLSMLGGNFFPFELMPNTMAAIGRLTPNGFAVARFKEMLSGAIQPAHLAAGFALFALTGALAFLLAVRRLRRGFLV